MTILTRNKRTAGYFLVSEGNRTISRAVITIAAGQTLVAGQVLALNDEGNYTSYDNDATVPGRVARAILFDNTDTTDGAVKAVAIVRDAEVNGDEIVFAGSEDTGDKEAAYADLASVGIIVRFEERVT